MNRIYDVGICVRVHMYAIGIYIPKVCTRTYIHTKPRVVPESTDI